MSHSFALLVPVKTLTLAKSRLGSEDDRGRQDLMRAFALDALSAATQCSAVSQVCAVTDEPGLEVAGVTRLPDEGDGDLNLALHHAALRVRLGDPGLAVAAMCADVPCLVPDDLAAALGAGLSPRWFVADAAGTGTTLLAAGPGTDLEPHFGTGSARRHEESGAVPVRAAVPTLRLDVDTEDDLARAAELGVGRHTATALRARTGRP
jgi:2-phospho-L-lactate guanylyltransferase